MLLIILLLVNICFEGTTVYILHLKFSLLVTGGERLVFSEMIPFHHMVK